MSRKEAWIKTNTKLTLDEVCQWLESIPGWQDCTAMGSDHRRVFQTTDKFVKAILIDVGNHRPGTAKNSVKHLGSPTTIMFDFDISRSLEAIGRLDEIYKVAIAFSKHDDCNFLFSLDDENVGVISRRDGTCFINPDEFQAASLAALLTFPFEFKPNFRPDLR